MHQGLAHWHAFLLKKPLPVLDQTKKDVQALIDQAQLSITQYSGPIFFDAGLSAVLFQHANGLRQSSKKNPLTTLSNVLSYLGQAAFQGFLNKTITLESLNLPEKNRQGFIKVMGQSCHASFQARDWVIQRSAAETEVVQLAALLQNITELMLWCYADDVMPRIEELYFVHNLSYQQAAKKILGCDMRELGVKLSNSWHLPEMVIQGFITKQDDFTLATGVSLASELARTVARSWYNKQAINVIGRIAGYKGKAEGEIERRLHLITVSINDVLINKGYVAPAGLLFQLVDDEYKYPEFSINKDFVNQSDSKNDNTKQESALKNATKENKINPLKKKIKEVEKTKSSDSRKAILEKIKARKLALKLTEEKERDAKPSLPINKELALAKKEFEMLVSNKKMINELINSAVNMCLFVGVQRCVFLIKVKNKNLLMTKFSAEVSEDVAIKDFSISLDNPHLFSRLLEKKSGVFLNDTNRSKYWGIIPDRIKMLLGVKSFFVSSVFVNNHAVGIMYGDKIKGELTPAEFSQFKAISHLLSAGIEKSLIRNEA